MKIWKRFLCLCLTLGLLAGCTFGETMKETSMEQTISELKALGESPDDNYRTWYEIFVYSFCDSDGDGIGDLKGAASKLDYLQELGINGIWLMPIHPSSSYHKYNVRDYYAIDPDYGTMDDFTEFMSECEKRDIHVILDLVINHSGADHSWFQNAVTYLQQLGDEEPDAVECPYVDYYNFSKEAQTAYTQVPGTDWYYESQFSPEMPDLNLGSETVRSEIKEIMQFWLDKGVDGFRLDAAKEFYSGTTEKNVEVLSWLQETAVSLKEDCYLVAEVWDTFSTITAFYESKITGIFDYPFGDTSGKIITVLRNAGNAETVKTYASALEKADKAYLGANPDYIDAPFLSNHDVGRIAGFCSVNEQKTKLAGAMNLFMSGSAFIYYGEEIGMVGSGNDPSKRAPMYWNVNRDEGTTNPPPECELPEEYPFGSLEEQKENPFSIYNYYRQAIAIRQAIPAISHGRTTEEIALNKDCISAFRKTWEAEECIILMNISEESKAVDLSSYEEWSVTAKLLTDENPIASQEGILQLPAYGVVVLTKEN